MSRCGWHNCHDSWVTMCQVWHRPLIGQLRTILASYWLRGHRGIIGIFGAHPNGLTQCTKHMFIFPVSQFFPLPIRLVACWRVFGHMMVIHRCLPRFKLYIIVWLTDLTTHWAAYKAMLTHKTVFITPYPRLGQRYVLKNVETSTLYVLDYNWPPSLQSQASLSCNYVLSVWRQVSGFGIQIISSSLWELDYIVTPGVGPDANYSNP